MDSFRLSVLMLAACTFYGSAIAAETDQRAVRDIQTIRIEATGSRYEPLQHISPYTRSRHVSDYNLTVTWNPAGRKAREDWGLNTIYPFPAKLEFWAVYHEQRGERMGRDGFRPSTEGPVQPARIGAVFKDLWLSNPMILLAHAESSPTSAVERNGIQYERRMLAAHGSEWVLLVEQQSGLPLELSTIENDPLQGEVNNRIVFSDWREVSGVPFPHKLEQYVDDNMIRRETRHSITVNPVDAEQALQLAGGPDQEADEDLRQWGWTTSNFFLRRMAMGAPADEDQSRVVEFKELANGIYHVLGSSHHNLIIVGPDGLTIVDAVWYPRRSEAILSKLREKWPDNPLKTVVLTHHHVDHTGGLMPYVDAGAKIVISASNEPYFSEIFNASAARSSALNAVQRHAVLNDTGRDVEVFEVLASHANGYLAVYVPDEKLAFNSDLYSPGRPAQQKTWAKELLDAIEFHEIDVETHVGGHGNGTQPHEHLVELTREP